MVGVTPRFVDSACHTEGKFVPVVDRVGFASADLCLNCFDQAATVDQIPDDFDLCRTYSRRGTTLHRTFEDADERLTHGSHDTSGYTEDWTALDQMDPDEFEREVLGGDV